MAGCTQFSLRKPKIIQTKLIQVPPAVYRGGFSPPGGVPGPYLDLGTPRGGTRTSVPPWGGTQTSVPPPRGGVRVPPRLMAFWEMLQSIMGYGYPPCGQTDGWMEGQTRVKTLPSLVLRTRAVIIFGRKLGTKIKCKCNRNDSYLCLFNSQIDSWFKLRKTSKKCCHL